MQQNAHSIQGYFFTQLGNGKIIVRFRKDVPVFDQGDPADAVFYIQSGRVKLTVLSNQGNEVVVGILEPGQFFGEGCLNGQKLRIFTATAMEVCVVTSIGKSALIEALHREPALSDCSWLTC